MSVWKSWPYYWPKSLGFGNFLRSWTWEKRLSYVSLYGWSVWCASACWWWCTSAVGHSTAGSACLLVTPICQLQEVWHMSSLFITKGPVGPGTDSARPGDVKLPSPSNIIVPVLELCSSPWLVGVNRNGGWIPALQQNKLTVRESLSLVRTTLWLYFCYEQTLCRLYIRATVYHASCSLKRQKIKLSDLYNIDM